MTAFDTNVLIYCCDGGDRKRQAKALDLIGSTSDGVLLWQVACEFIAASRKLALQGFSPEDAWRRLGEFLSLFPLVTPPSQVLARARELHLSQGWSFWDAMIVGACLESHSIVFRGSTWSGSGGNRDRESVRLKSSELTPPAGRGSLRRGIISPARPPAPRPIHKSRCGPKNRSESSCG